MLENMGFRVVDERTFEVAARAGDPGAWLHDMVLERADGAPADLDKLKPALEASFIVVMRGVAENDGYNALVMAAGLGWRDVALIRTISRFLRQIRVPYSQDYMWATLRKHAALATKIVELFHARFDPRAQGEARRDAASARPPSSPRSRTALGKVDSLDEDRIVRRFVNAVQSAIRTNYYQLGKDGQPKQEISIKFSSRKLDGVPKPAPLYEIFVYSPRFEAVHMRFGKVARGGIRWSDRPQDFRTEILGLVKAQQVKNAVIVPVGSKGGYVPKRMPVGGTREAIAGRGRRDLQAVHAVAARHHRQPRSQGRGAARQRGAPRRRRSLSRRRRRQGHRDLLRHRQRHFRGAPLLARRRLRLRRLGRLRPQGHGHHRPRRLGIGEAAFPRDGHRHHARRRSPRSASATCRATCSATACCARRR